MSLRIVADENIPAALHYFGALGEVELVNGRNLQPEQLRGADVLLVRSVTRVDAALLAYSDLTFVGSATSGLDHVDQACLQRRGISFAHAPGSNANSVVEYVLAAVAAVEDWLERLLAGGCVGIVGYGHIGRAMSARLEALGIDYRVYDPWLDPGLVAHHATLAEVLACDVITLHPELTLRQPWPSHHLLGASELAGLGGRQLLINASRGAVVNNAALKERLQGEHPPAVVLDVWEGEPRIDAALLESVRLGSAHIAGYSLDGKLLGTRMLWQALVGHLGLEIPVPASPAAELPPLRLAGDAVASDAVRGLFDQRYDIRCDDAALRQSVAERDPAEAFDRLRREYRERRELCGSVVVAPGDCDPRVTGVVRGLGCQFAGTREGSL